MIDSHVHLLPGVDDGAQDDVHALEMFERAKVDGVTHWIVTPHLNHACSKYSYEELKEKYADWRETLKQNSVYDSLVFGVEVYVDEAFLDEISTMEMLPTFENSNYMLIEFNRNTKLEMMQAVIHELKLRRVIPIMAHVEVYKVFIDHPVSVKSLADEGALIQVSANTILDKRYQAFVRTLIQLNAIDLIASDGHNLNARKPLLSEAYNHVAKSFSKVWADRLFIESPKIVYSGLKYKRPLTLIAPKKRFYVGIGLTSLVAMALIFMGASQLNLFNNNGMQPAEVALEETSKDTETTEVFNLTDESLASGAANQVGGSATTVGAQATETMATAETTATEAEAATDAKATTEVGQTVAIPPTYASIEENYVSQLRGLQDQYTADIQRIYNSIQDTRNFVTNEVKRKAIINTYLEEAGTLETICDNNVYDLLYDFQNELETYQYEVTVIEDVRAEYHRIKEATKNEYLSNF